MIVAIDMNNMTDIPESISEDFYEVVSRGLEVMGKMPHEQWMQGFMTLAPTVRSFMTAIIMHGPEAF